MIAQGATLPDSTETASGAIRVPSLHLTDFDEEQPKADGHQVAEAESLTLTNMQNHSQTMIVLPAASTTSSSLG